MTFFSKSFWICGFFELVWFIALNTESESENIINLLLASQVLMKSKARSTAYLALTQLFPVLLISRLHIVKYTHFVAFCYISFRSMVFLFLAMDAFTWDEWNFSAALLFDFFCIFFGNISLITFYRCIGWQCKQWRFTQTSVYIHVPFDHATSLSNSILGHAVFILTRLQCTCTAWSVFLQSPLFRKTANFVSVF